MFQKYKNRLVSRTLFHQSIFFTVIFCASMFTVLHMKVHGNTLRIFPVLQIPNREAAQQVDSNIQELENGKPIEGQLAGAEVHVYQVSLNRDQYLRVVIDHKGLNSLLKIFGPDRQEIADVHEPGSTEGSESLSILAGTAGIYRLQVSSLSKDARPGYYTIRIEELRPQQATDKSRIRAERIFIQGERLRAQGSAESSRQAIQKYEESLPLWKEVGEASQAGAALNNIALIYSGLGENQKAIEYYLQAIHTLHSAGDFRTEAVALTGIGKVYDDLGEKQKALHYYHQALPLRRTAADHRGEASTLNNLGRVYNNLGENQKALDYYLQALEIWRNLRDLRGEAVTLNNIGTAYNLQGDKRKALEYYNQAITILRSIGERYVAAYTLTSIGGIHSYLGEKQKALDYFLQALPLRQIVGDRRGEASSLHSIGSLYNELGDPQRALEYFTKALPIIQVVGDRQVEASMRNSMGIAYTNLGDQARALDYFNQALILRKAVSDPRGEAVTLNNIGQMYAKQKAYRVALDYYRRALQLSRGVQDPDRESTALNNIGAAYSNLGERENAIRSYSLALQLKRSLSDLSGQAATLMGIGQLEMAHGNLAIAREQFETALNIIESQRIKVDSQELRASYLASKLFYFDTYIDLLMQLHKKQPLQEYNAVALQVSERAKARSLLEMLTEAQADIRQGIDPNLLTRKLALQQLLNFKAEQQSRLLGSRHNETQATAVKKEVDDLVTEYQQIEANIRASSPKYAALTQPQPLGLKAIQQQLVDTDTLLLEYALGDTRSYLWAVTRTSMISFELPKRAEIDVLARRCYELLTARNKKENNESRQQRQLRLKQARAEYPAIATKLSQILLSPVASLLGKKKLIIVADGVLEYLPFAALPEPSKKAIGMNNQPLIINHEIVTLPSISTLATLRKELVNRKAAPKTVAVIADPVFDKEDTRVTQAINAQKHSSPAKEKTDRPSFETVMERALRDLPAANTTVNLPRLLFTRQEAAAIMLVTPQSERKQALDFEASKSTAIGAELGQYRIVHFATHGLLNSVHPELSGIVLSLVNEKGEPQDGFLRLHEIYNLKLPAELVVLSACQTGLGKEIRGEGMVGLTRGFMYAGAARVIASLWKVDDEATAELMKILYKAMLKQNRRPAAALREAQVRMLKQKDWQHPYFWAAFTIQGEWR
jgi:CHAT domain-containing protein/Tfp pilus assembly protein PilF